MSCSFLLVQFLYLDLPFLRMAQRVGVEKVGAWYARALEVAHDLGVRDVDTLGNAAEQIAKSICIYTDGREHSRMIRGELASLVQRLANTAGEVVRTMHCSPLRAGEFKQGSNSIISPWAYMVAKLD